MAYVAGDLLVSVRGTLGGAEEFSNTWCVHCDSFTVGDPQSVADNLHDFYDDLATGAAPIWNDQVIINGCRVVDLFNNVELAVTWASITGDNGAEMLPSECALRISITDGFSRGGPFLPPLATNGLATNGQLLTSYQTIVVNALNDLVTAMVAEDQVWSLNRPTDSTANAVIAAKVGRTFDVIRRRRNEMPESYAAVTIP